MRPESFISKILHPLIALPVAAVIFLTSSGLEISTAFYWISLWISLSLVPTAVVVWNTGEKGFNIMQRENRRKAFLTGLTSLGLALIISWNLSAPSILLKLGFTGLLIVVIFAVANHFSKVSIHTGALTATTAVYTEISTAAILITGLLSVLVGRSRVKLQKHTLRQVVLGGLTGIFCGAIFLML